MEHERLESIRHSLAHLTAAAVLELYPGAENSIGPAIESGFYQDFEMPEPISEKDLPKIEKKMKEILKSWNGFEKKEVSAEEAKEVFAHNKYKLELIDEHAGKGEALTIYTSGDFVDFCKGGHVDNPAKEIDPDAFMLDRIAGAYWRGDEKNKMLTRIYGLAFESKKDLEKYLEQREEAKKRDHRVIGKDMNLFTFSDLVGPGLPLFTPRGQAMRETISELLWNISRQHGYEKVSIPHITKLDLYETSGHADKFREEFFYVTGAQSNDEFVMKPMNCPHHTQIFASKPRSYRELPVRMSELTHMYRDEKPGQLLGLSRVRAISIDDAHVFCTKEQIKQEAITMVEIIKEFYSAFGLWKKGETFWVSLSVRDTDKPEDYLGEDKNWEAAEAYLQEVSDELGLDAKRMEGEAAFYGPKLDFMFTDVLGRERQLATVQIDFVMPERFGLEYTNDAGKKERAVMIHRAVSGSLERFMAIMIEHFAGAFPLWLSPVQIKVLPISEKQCDYADKVFKKLKEANIRVELDNSNETLGKKIRNAKQEKIPYFLVIGDKEVESNEVMLEGREGQVGAMSVDDLTKRLQEEIKSRKV